MHLLGQTELFKHFVDIKVCAAYEFRSSPLKLMLYLQRAHDPEYTAMMDALLKPKGRGRKKAG